MNYEIVYSDIDQITNAIYEQFKQKTSSTTDYIVNWNIRLKTLYDKYGFSSAEKNQSKI